MTDFVYFATDGALVKIGRSIQPTERCRFLETRILFAIVDFWGYGNRRLEQAMHKHFREKWVTGEWFDLNDKDIEEVRDLVLLEYRWEGTNKRAYAFCACHPIEPNDRMAGPFPAIVGFARPKPADREMVQVAPL